MSLFCAVVVLSLLVLLLLLLLPSVLVLLLLFLLLSLLVLLLLLLLVGQLLTWPPCSPDLSPLDFHLWQEWETALVERQFTSQLELRAMIVRTMSCLDPEAAEKACTVGFIRRCLACVRAKGGHFGHRL